MWTQQLIEAISVCTVAGAVCRYYWKDQEGLGWAVLGSLYNAFRYHLGSLIFGSCILAVVQFFRLTLEYLDRQTSGTDNAVVRTVKGCCKVCLWCVHKCLKFMSKSGYIIIAMKGTSFCSSVTQAFQLLTSNAVRVATVSIISCYVLFMGKLFITVSCTFAFYYHVTVQKPYELSSVFPPLVVVALLAYAMSYFYLAIFDIAVDSILLSVCEDEKINRPTGLYYASSKIRKYLDNSEAQAFQAHRDMKGKTKEYQGV
jgi:hypothetical protein